MGFQLTYDIWKYQSFRRLFFAGFLTSISRWFEFLTFSIIIWELTGNAAIVGYIMTADLIPALRIDLPGPSKANVASAA